MPIVRTPEHRAWIALLRKRLPPEKVQHCVFVAEYMASFAPALGIDHDEAVAAGLLHDLCRAMPGEVLTARAKDCGLPLDEWSRARPNLLHGPVAAEEARNALGIVSDDVYDAIYWHTTGRADWTPLGCALYLADFSEPSRTYPEAGEVRDVLRTAGFSQALRHAVAGKAVYQRKKSYSHPAADAFRAWVESTVH